MSDQTIDQEPASLSLLISHIASLIAGRGALSTGDVAALRRMDPRHPVAAFFKVAGLVLDDLLPGDASARTDAETRWAAVVVGLAHLGSLHQQGQRLGSALATADYSEMRFARLLGADSDRLTDELPALARFLVAKGVTTDWTAAAHLILSADRKDEQSVRRHIARDYYAALLRHESA